MELQDSNACRLERNDRISHLQSTKRPNKKAEGHADKLESALNRTDAACVFAWELDHKPGVSGPPKHKT